jgi:outer membrane lipoprotein-sorting protein
MYSKEENQKLKHEFWVEFAQKYPRKWVLYDTKIKDFSFKFYVENTKAQVHIDIEMRNKELRMQYFEKLEALKNILEDEFIKDLVFERNLTLENGKTISRIWVEKGNVSVSNRKYWNEIFDFFFEKMNALELFYQEYDGFIKDIEI